MPQKSLNLQKDKLNLLFTFTLLNLTSMQQFIKITVNVVLTMRFRLLLLLGYDSDAHREISREGQGFW